jgi:uncharacterized protein
MELIEDVGDGFTINSVAPGQITIGETVYTNSLIVAPTQVLPDWEITHVDQLTPMNCQALLRLNPKLILLGTGARHALPDPKVIALFGQQKIGLEVMSTAAACRTYNVVMAEGRQVVAALIIE